MWTKARMRRWLEDRFFLRIHMTLILLGTFLTGVVATRMLMRSGVNVLALRYAVAVVLAYAVFLGLVKLWLMYVRSDTHVDLVDMEDAGELAADIALRAPLHSPGGGSSSSFDLSLDVGDDLGGLILMIVIIAIVFLLGGIAIYFIWTAPVLLGEAAFEAVLAASIVRRAKKAAGAGWLGAVWRATVWPFLGVLALSIVLGWFAQHRCPDALKLRDAVNCGER